MVSPACMKQYGAHYFFVSLGKLTVHTGSSMASPVWGAKYVSLRQTLPAAQIANDLVVLVAAYVGCCHGYDLKPLLRCANCMTTTCVSCLSPSGAVLLPRMELAASSLGCHLCQSPLDLRAFLTLLLDRNVWFVTGTNNERHRLHSVLGSFLDSQRCVIRADNRNQGTLAFSRRRPISALFCSSFSDQTVYWQISSAQDPQKSDVCPAHLILRCESATLDFAERKRHACLTYFYSPVIPSLILYCIDYR